MLDSPQRQLHLPRTSTLPEPNRYVRMMQDDFAAYAYTEEQAPAWKGLWREKIFGKASEYPLDLEIGTGNGFHFAHYARKFLGQRSVVGLELKYKPLVQSIRRALRAGCDNARIARYDANLLTDLFADGDLNNVLIHFPDPWPKKRGWKHRLIQDEFLLDLHRLQRPGSLVEFKTDSRDYFDWTMEHLRRGPHRMLAATYDLHNSEWSKENFVTQFESIFLKQKLPIHFVRLLRE